MSIRLPYEVASSDPSDAQLTRDSRDRKHPNKSRVQKAIPYTTIWGLEAILDAAKEGREIMVEIRRWIDRERIVAKGRYDREQLVRLGELDALIADLALRVGQVERFASDARVGVYSGPERTKPDATQ